MIKEIKYNGFTATPSDYECPDGDLATVIGLVPEDEALHPVQPPVNIFQLPVGYTVCFVHANATGYRHYIIRHDYTTDEGTAPDIVTHKHSVFYWLNMPASYINYADTDTSSEGYLAWNNIITNNSIVSFTDKDIYDVNAIGNTLLLLTSDGTYYCLWKGTNTGYLNLGNHLPELPLSFGLQGERVESNETFNVEYHETVPYDKTIKTTEFDDAVKETVTEQVLARVNKFIAENYTNGNRFMYPFFVRYAFRLYDESLTMHSAPILMVCSIGQNPYVLGGTIAQTDHGWDGTWDNQVLRNCKVYGALYKLDFAVVNQSYINALGNWSDIIKSVDIFISSPLYSYDQNGMCTGIDGLDGDEIGGKKKYCICKFKDSNDSNEEYFEKYHQFHYMSWFFWYGKDSYPGWSIRLPMKGEKAIYEDTISESKFYILKSYKIESLSTVRQIVDVESGYFNSLTNRELMTDDINSHNNIIAKYSFGYNSRLNLSGISEVVTRAYHMSSMINFTDSFLQPSANDITVADTRYEDIKQAISLFVYLKTDENEVVVSSFDFNSNWASSEAKFAMFTPQPYIYYPDPRAYKAIIIFRRSDGWIYRREIKLDIHDFLNGAVFFNGWAEISGTETYQTPTISTLEERTIGILNKIYTSEVDNPFVFLSKGRRTIGISKIVGIRPAVKAMSPSQYGQFKFYVFTLEGVWALEVSSEGYLQQPTLVTHDVVMGANDGNVRSITQIQGAVLFASERGIMMLEGSTCTCISDILNSQDPFMPFGATPDKDVLPGLRSVCGFAIDNATLVPFRTFIQDCSMLYDYPHQRIILYSPTHDYAYVFSLKSKLWGMIPSTIQSTVLDYPNAMAMIKVSETVEENNNPVQYEYPVFADYSRDPAPDALLDGVHSLIITRPLKLDMPDVLKTIDTVIQRGHFRRGHVKTILYGSRDLFHWHPVYSSTDHYLRGFRGTPYKYFRIALLCTLDKDESIYGCTVQYTPRLIDQPR